MLHQCKNCLDILDPKKYYQTCRCFTNTEDNTGIFVDYSGGEIYRIGGKIGNIRDIDDDKQES